MASVYLAMLSVICNINASCVAVGKANSYQSRYHCRKSTREYSQSVAIYFLSVLYHLLVTKQNIFYLQIMQDCYSKHAPSSPTYQ